MTLSTVWQLLFWAWFASELIVGVATRTRHNAGKVHDRGSLVLLWIVLFTSITAATWISEARPPTMFGGVQALKTAGLVVLIIALIIRWSAIITLGKSFSSNVAIHESQQINRSGLYRFIRHPSYLGLLLAFLAIGLHSRNWLSLGIVLLPTTAAVLYRIHVEESALIQAFGEQYVAYSKVTNCLIPGVY